MGAHDLAAMLLGATGRTRRARIAGLVAAGLALVLWFGLGELWRTPLVPLEVTCLAVTADGTDGGYRTLAFEKTTVEYRKALRRELEATGQTVEEIGGRLRLSLAGSSGNAVFSADGPVDSPETYAHWVSYGAMLRLVQTRLDIGVLNRQTLESFTVTNPATGAERVLDPGNCAVMEQFVLIGGRFAAE